jgi:hypothetical protein
MKVNEMGGACSTYGGGTSEGNRQLGKLGVDEWIILICKRK